MIPDIVILLIAGITGNLIGTAAGFVIRGLFVPRQLRRKERETWAIARNFYERLIRP